MTDITPAFIVKIMNDKGIVMSLSEAFDVANAIFDAHCDRINVVENMAFDRGTEYGKDLRNNERYQEGKEAGFAEGVREGRYQGRREVLNGRTLDHMNQTYEESRKHFMSLARAIVFDMDRTKKIPMIKQLREESGMGLKFCKDLIDEAYGSIYG
jgi:predicted transposase YdaD